MSDVFYVEHLPTCDICGKPASAAVYRTGKIAYGHVCPRHEKSRVAHLERVYSVRRSPAAPEGAMSLEDTARANGQLWNRVQELDTQLEAARARVRKLEGALQIVDDLMTAHHSGNRDWGEVNGPHDTYFRRMQATIRAAVGAK